MIEPHQPPETSEAVHHRAVQTLFSLFEELCEGAITVDREARVVWLNDKYAALLGLDDARKAIGRPVEEVIPNSLLRQVVETGEPILLDIMPFGERSFVVTRMPLRDDAGTLTGAIGFVLYDRPEYLKPLVSKFTALRSELARAQRELAEHRRAKYSVSQFVGNSPPAVEVKRQARLAAASDATVILYGETGTGKELIAHAIHAASARADGPFVGLNVAAVPDALLEAEFYGVAPGAYTGADPKGRAGKFAVANGGTLFLDEVGDMPLAMQVKLLRALQEREIEPVGSNAVTKIDVRVIAATGQNLERRAAEGAFRADLFYRLNVLPIALPPLRDRVVDLAALVEVMAEQVAVQTGQRPRDVSRSAIARLAEHDWPGNVRELRNVVERVTAMTDRGRLEAEDFDAVLPPPRRRDGRAAIAAVRPLSDTVREAEAAAVRAALRTTAGNKAAAARMLGVSRARFYEKLARYGIVS